MILVITYEQLLHPVVFEHFMCNIWFIPHKSLWGRHFPVEEARTQRDEVICTTSHTRKLRHQDADQDRQFPKLLLAGKHQTAFPASTRPQHSKYNLTPFCWANSFLPSTLTRFLLDVNPILNTWITTMKGTVPVIIGLTVQHRGAAVHTGTTAMGWVCWGSTDEGHPSLIWPSAWADSKVGGREKLHRAEAVYPNTWKPGRA